jgi:AcrR family transcriptional regulator
MKVSIPRQPSANRWEQRQQHTRHALMQAALELVVERGFEKVTVASIADRANYGRSTFYTYFPDKAAVVWALFERYMGVLDAHIVASVQHLASPQREYESWRVIFQNLAHQREFFTQMSGTEGLPLRRMAKDFLIQQFEGHLRAGRFSLLTEVPPEIVARVFVANMFEMVEYWLTHPEISIDTLVDHLFVLIFRQAVPTQAVHTVAAD